MSDLDDDAESDAIALRVGRIAIEAGRLETMAANLYAGLLQGPLAHIVTRGQSWATVRESSRALIKRWRAIALQRGEDWRLPYYDQMAAALAAADGLMVRRADVVHGFWFLGRNSAAGLPSTHRSLYHGKHTNEEWPLARLDELRNDLRRSMLAISELAAWLATNPPRAQ